MENKLNNNKNIEVINFYYTMIEEALSCFIIKGILVKRLDIDNERFLEFKNDYASKLNQKEFPGTELEHLYNICKSLTKKLDEDISSIVGFDEELYSAELELKKTFDIVKTKNDSEMIKLIKAGSEDIARMYMPLFRKVYLTSTVVLVIAFKENKKIIEPLEEHESLILDDNEQEFALDEIQIIPEVKEIQETLVEEKDEVLEEPIVEEVLEENIIEEKDKVLEEPIVKEVLEENIIEEKDEVLEETIVEEVLEENIIEEKDEVLEESVIEEKSELSYESQLNEVINNSNNIVLSDFVKNNLIFYNVKNENSTLVKTFLSYSEHQQLQTIFALVLTKLDSKILNHYFEKYSETLEFFLNQLATLKTNDDNNKRLILNHSLVKVTLSILKNKYSDNESKFSDNNILKIDSVYLSEENDFKLNVLHIILAELSNKIKSMLVIKPEINENGNIMNEKLISELLKENIYSIKGSILISNYDISRNVNENEIIEFELFKLVYSKILTNNLSSNPGLIGSILENGHGSEISSLDKSIYENLNKDELEYNKINYTRVLSELLL